MATKKPEQKIVSLVIDPIKLETMTLEVTGDQLLMDKMTERQKKIMQTYFEGNVKKMKIEKKRTSEIAEIEKDEDIIEEKIHKTYDGKPGFPAIGFKKGMMAVAQHAGLYKKDANILRVLGDVIPIKYDKKLKSEMWGKTSGQHKTPIRIVRPLFTNWSCQVTIQFDSTVITAQSVANLLNRAGFEQGLGGFRPQFGGNFGVYKVKTSKSK